MVHKADPFLRGRVFAAWVAAIALLSAATSIPAEGAPLQPGDNAGPEASSAASERRADRTLRSIEVSRPPLGPSRRDGGRNGLSDELEARLSGLSSDDPVDVIVTFVGPGSAASAMRSVGVFSVRHQYSLIPGFAATVSAAQARALAATPGVFRVELDGTMHAYMENARRDFGVDLADGTSAISAGLTGVGMIICVVDTGIWPNHELFLAETGFVDPNTTKVAKFADFIGEGGTGVTLDGTLAHDEHYHGTFVSGIAAGDGTPVPLADGGDPVLAWPLRGVAPDATLWGAQVLQPDPFGNATGPNSGVIAGIDWCVAEALADGVIDQLVINLSLGDPGANCNGDAVVAAVDAAYALGAVVIAAAGNSGDEEESMGPPACAAGAFPVAAAADHSLPFTPGLEGTEDNGRFVAPWSSRGAAMRRGVAGPGMNIAAAFNSTTEVFNAGCTLGQPGCYAAASGTSFASPFVAGLAALLRQADAALGPEEIYQILRDTSVPWGPDISPNEVAGSGMVDGFAAVEAAMGGTACVDYTPSATPAYSKVTGGVGNNGSIQFPVWVVDPSLPLAITMSIDGIDEWRRVWDPDLELTLRDANGDPYEIEILPGLFFPVPGTTSTCPAGEICGSFGAQETIRRRAAAGGG